jgi:Na+-transporting NADH:ubiquinone oxidoreductase subunit F
MDILLSVAVMNGIAMVIVAILIVLNKFVAVYADYNLRVNDVKVYLVQGGQPVTKQLFKNQIYLPSACGGKGTCGFCKVRVIDGLKPPLPIEDMLLTHKEISMGFRLGCQTKIRSEMNIEIPPELLEVKEYSGEVYETKQLTSDITRLKILLVEPKEIDFKSGQYVLVEVIVEETRAYSIASSNLQKGEIHIEVKLVPGGLCSPYLHSLQPGDKIRFFGPYGQFYLRDTDFKVICVAGGVGLAPMKPIIDDVLRSYPNRKVELYYGAKAFKDLYDHDMLVDIAQEHERFQYYPALSESDGFDVEGDYPVSTGFIHTLIRSKVIDGPSSEGYLCGPPVMIDAVVKELVEKGVPEIRILYDKF